MGLSLPAISLLATMLALGVGQAQSAPPQRGRGMMAAPQYDLKAEVTLNVIVAEVRVIPGPGPRDGGVHLVVKDGLNAIDVALGPEWYVSDRKYSFAPTDAILLTGSRVTVDGRESILAREIKRGDQTMTFRDAKGFPLWAGRGRGER